MSFIKAIIKLSTIQGVPLLQPSNTNLTYDPLTSPNTPYFNGACISLLSQKSKDKLITFKCVCNETTNETKLALEKIYELRAKLKSAKSPLLDVFANTFLNISIYLNAEFKKQPKITKNSMNSTDVVKQLKMTPIGTFIAQKSNLPLNEFSIKYSNFLLYHILERFGSTFKKFKSFEVSTLLKNEFDSIKCRAKTVYEEGHFKSLNSVIQFVNKRTLQFIDYLSVNQNDHLN